jgi:hypothetical protein
MDGEKGFASPSGSDYHTNKISGQSLDDCFPLNIGFSEFSLKFGLLTGYNILYHLRHLKTHTAQKYIKIINYVLLKATFKAFFPV